MRIWLLPASLSSRVSQHNADRSGEMASFLPRTIFYEESVLLKYFPLDASCVSRTWYCQLEPMTAETNTPECCGAMACGSGAAQHGGAGGTGRDAGEHPGWTRNDTGAMGEQPHPRHGRNVSRNSWNDVLLICDTRSQRTHRLSSITAQVPAPQSPHAPGGSSRPHALPNRNLKQGAL